MNLQKLLAENMLRFGSKNLDSKAKRTLKRLAEQGVTNTAPILTKFTGVDKWLDSILKSANNMTPNQVYSGNVGNYVVSYVTSVSDSASSGGAGSLFVYSIYSYSGLPILNLVCSFTNSEGVDWRKETTDKYYTKSTMVDFKSLEGRNNIAKFNTFWSKLNSNTLTDSKIVTEKFKTECINAVKLNQTALQTSFKTYYDIDPSTKKRFADSPAASFRQTQYFVQVDEPVKDMTARAIYNIIKDPQTIAALGGQV